MNRFFINSLSREIEMTGIFHKLLVCLLCVSLFSCAGGGSKLSTDKADKPETAEGGIVYVNVDPEVEFDYIKALTLLQEGDFKQAVDILKTVIEREQRLSAPFINIAIAQHKLDDTTAAEENLVKALKLDSSHPIANNELGLLYRKTGKFKEARAAYENAISEHPDYLPAKINLGVLCDLYMHDFECALEQFEDYLELKPDDKTVSIWLVDVKNRL